MKKHTVLTLILLLLASATGLSQDPDVIVTNARIETMDSRYPEATAMAIKNGRITKLGSDQEIRALAGKKTVEVGAHGSYVMPGFTDSHAHFQGVGNSQRIVRLNGTQSFEEVIKLVQKEAKTRPAGEWITGRGWDQNLWSSKEFPEHDALSNAVPNHPVALRRVDGHALLTNKKAMDLAGMVRTTAAPAGGEIIRKENGEPTGVLIDKAMVLINEVVPTTDKATKRADMLAAQKLALSLGITSFHDQGTDRRDIELLDELYASGDLKLRLYVMLGVSDIRQTKLATVIPPRVGDHNGKLTVRGLKIYADGALGSRGAAMISDYADRIGHQGLLLTRQAAFKEMSRIALERGYQICVHAIGDRGNRMVLDTWADLFPKFPQVADPRFRIEHAQILHQDDIPRFASLGVIASMQAVHCTSDMAWVVARVTQGRAEVGAYAWRSLLDAGAVICNGTDSPVEALTPFAGLYASVTRMNAKGLPKGGWFGDQCMTRREALYSYTKAGAYASFNENSLGSLAPGKLADFILVDTNLRTCPPKELLKAKVRATYINGVCVYGR
ncbi:MAG: putative amidohydrolase YtcJ [Planctomycetota bacterium]|jgi:predicted amidohydrolase YtcJ